MLTIDHSGGLWSAETVGCEAPAEPVSDDAAADGQDAAEDVPVGATEDAPIERESLPAIDTLQPFAFTTVHSELSYGQELGLSRLWTAELDAVGRHYGPAATRTLRDEGYPVLGYELPMFGEDHAREAELLIGGTLTDYACSSTFSAAQCTATVEWMVFDRKTRTVLHTTTHDGIVRGISGHAAQIFHIALTTSLTGAMQDPAMRAALQQPASSTATHIDGALPACDRSDLTLPGDLEDLSLIHI